jgi:hypothetical protein
VWPVPTELVASALMPVGVPVRWSTPNPRLPEFVVVRALGGDRTQWSEIVLFDVEVWAGAVGDSPRRAAALAQQVREVLIQAPRTVAGIVSARPGPAQFAPDPVSAAPRFMLSAEVRTKPVD